TEIIQTERAKLQKAEAFLKGANLNEFNHARTAISNLLEEFNKVFSKPPNERPDKTVLAKMEAAFDIGNNNRTQALDMFNNKKDPAGAVQLLTSTLNDLRKIHQVSTTNMEQQDGGGWQALQTALDTKAKESQNKLEAEGALQDANTRMADAEREKNDAEQAR